MIDSLVHTPKSEAECALRLYDESWCAAYAVRLRWPQGFVCPVCAASHQGYVQSEKPLCRACGRSSSITAGTLLHGSKKSIATWLRALWWLSGEHTSVSIAKLKHHLGFRSYQTGWAWMKKLRFILHQVNRTQCRGIVLVDAVAADDCDKGDQLLTSVESIARGRSTGRLRIKVSAVLNQEFIAQFCRQAVTPGSIIIVPGRTPFDGFHMQEIVCTVDDSIFHHEDVLRISACYRLWRRQKKFRCTAQHNDQDLVDEFCYFYNRSLYTDRVHLFETLVSVALNHSHDDFRSLIEQSAAPGGVQ
ncbi:MAG: transposase [Desulfofustis sp.]|nr:transposase [Desulfofustis sp.]NNK58830.1 transposase [Desulfofustis sp.]